MSRSSVLRAVAHCFRTLSWIVFALVRLAFLSARSRSTLAAENLFLRKQLALFQERKTKPRRADDSTRWLMSFGSRGCAWRGGLVLVKRGLGRRTHRQRIETEAGHSGFAAHGRQVFGPGSPPKARSQPTLADLR